MVGIWVWIWRSNIIILNRKTWTEEDRDKKMIFILKLYYNFMYIYVQFLIQFILNFIHFIITKYCSFLLYFNIYSIMYGYLFCIISQNKNFYSRPGILLKKIYSFTQENKIRPLFGISKRTSILVKFNFFINIRKKKFLIRT